LNSDKRPEYVAIIRSHEKLFQLCPYHLHVLTPEAATAIRIRVADNCARPF